MNTVRASRWRPGAFSGALFVSALLHLSVLFGASQDPPATVEPIRIEATLRLPPARRAVVLPSLMQQAVPAPKPVLSPRAAPVRKALVSSDRKADTPVIAVQPVVLETDGVPKQGGDEQPVVIVPDVAVPPPVPVSHPFPVTVNPEATEMWPHQGRIVFQVRYGEMLDVARMIHTWSHDGERYTMRAEMETVGLARMFRKFGALQQSQGRVGPEGLAPTGFQEDLNGKQSHAVFDWDARRVMMSRPDRVREVPIDGVAEDILSLAHHLAFQADGMETIRVFVVAGRWGAEAELRQVAAERLRMPWGLVDTRHFHCEARNGEFGIDVWLSREHRNAPVRIRVDDRKQGHVIDEVAIEIELDGEKTEFHRTEEEKDMYKG